MPHIVRCIDDYFTQKKRDLYFITFGKTALHSNCNQLLDDDINSDDWDAFTSEPPGRDEMLSWLAEHLPDVEVAPLFAITWDSGIICMPYDGTISIDFDEKSLAIFMEHWEDGDGKSLDPRMQCYLMPLSNYLKKHGGHYPTPPDFEKMWSELQD